MTFADVIALIERLSDYENQRLHLLHKHGIDIGDSVMDGRKTRRMTPREIEQLMGGGDSQGGLFTWRDKHRRKVSVNLCRSILLQTCSIEFPPSWRIQCELFARRAPQSLTSMI